MKIIGISGISGSGKTMLVKALSKHLNASSLFWDDFDEISKSPSDYVAWFEQGKNYAEFDYPALANTLHKLKQGNSVVHPVTKDKIEATQYIIVDAPLGRAHKQTAQYIDYFFHIDIPLDIAMARRIIRDAQNSAYTKQSIVDDLSDYLTKSRKLFSEDSMCSISNSADYVIDGTENVGCQVNYILECISQKEKTDIQNIKIEIVDEIDDATEKKMREGFVAYESQHSVNVNYKRFSLVMSENNNTIGVLNAYTVFSEIYVDDLWIDKAFRRMGYGRTLLLELEKRFKGKGFNNINLVTSAFQASEFYKKCGYKAEFKRFNEKNSKLTKTFFIKFFGEETQNQGVI